MWCFFVFEKLAEQSLALMGWQIDNHWDLNINQCVMIAAPHTSNWDALYARLALKALGVHVRITIKDSYMKLPFGPFVRAMGGIGIDRRPKHEGEPRPSMVQLMSDLFKEHPKLVMLVTPEGTRAKQEQWKTGFYHVAVSAGVPIALAYMDYAKKKTGVGKIIYPTGGIIPPILATAQIPTLLSSFSIKLNCVGNLSIGKSPVTDPTNSLLLPETRPNLSLLIFSAI